ncbi:MAG: DUF3990 domain-containing protein [Clostridiales bacterium]|nr:DUF3990 domain-containing protein [Clostridiales bacterium]
MFRNIKTTLYHGTISEIVTVDVNAGRSRKDFGKGFYMAVTKKQAIGMMHKKYREGRGGTLGCGDNKIFDGIFFYLT